MPKTAPAPDAAPETAPAAAPEPAQAETCTWVILMPNGEVLREEAGLRTVRPSAPAGCTFHMKEA